MTTGIFYALAISAATWRTAIRVRLGQGLEIDDGLLFLACIFITISTVLLYISISYVYMFEHLATHVDSTSTYDDLLKRLIWFRAMMVAHEVLCQSATFTIRLSFLLFFRRLIDRLGRIIYYWRSTVIVTAAVFPSFASLVLASKYPRAQWNCYLFLIGSQALWTSMQSFRRISIPIATVALLLSIGNELMRLRLFSRISAIC